MKHDCRFKSIRRREPVPLDVDGVIVVLPVVVGSDRRSVGVVDCENGIAERLAYTKGTQRGTKGAHDDGCASHVSNNKSTNEHVIACVNETATADVPQFRVKPGPVKFVNFGQGSPLGYVLSGHHHGVGAGGQVRLQSG